MAACSFDPVYPDTSANMLVLAGGRGEVVVFSPGDMLQVKLRDGSRRVGVLQQVKPGFLILGGRGLGFESIVWFREYSPTRDAAGKVLAGAGAGLTIAALVVGSSPEGDPNAGVAALAGAGIGLATAGIITLAARRKYRTSVFRLLVMPGMEELERKI